MKKHLVFILFFLMFINNTVYGGAKQQLPTLKLACHSTIGVGDSASVSVEYHGNLGLKGCEIKVSYEASVVSYSSYDGVYADFKVVKIGDNPGTVTIDGFFYPTASGDIPLLTLHFIGVAEGEAGVSMADSDLRGMDEENQLFYRRGIDYVVEVEGDIYVDNSAPTIDSILLESYDAGRVTPMVQGYIKNGDRATVRANGSEFPDLDWAIGVEADGVLANLTGLGGLSEALPDTFSYDELSGTWRATWVVNSVTCIPADGPVDIRVSITDKLGNGPTTGNGEVISDNTLPIIQNIDGIKIQDANGIALDKLDATSAKNGDTVKITATVADNTVNHNVVSGIPATSPCNHIKADLTSLNDNVGIAPADYSNPPTAQWRVTLVDCPEGQPSITVTASDLVGNQSSLSATLIINLDNIGPKSVTKFRTVPGNPVRLTWKFRGKYGKDYWGIRLCRKSSVHFHGGEPASLEYPQYDDSTPGAYPVYRKGAQGEAYYAGEIANHESYYTAEPNDEVLIDQQGDIESYADTSVVMDIYYYQSYAFDKAGNFSTPCPCHQDRDSATGYLLGDFDNNGLVNWLDLLPFMMALGKNHTFEHWQDIVFGDVRYMDCDIGPTARTPSRGDGSRFGLPKTDGVVNFDDLIIFAMNFAMVRPAPSFEPTVFPETTPLAYLDFQPGGFAAGEVFPVTLKLMPELQAKGAHLRLNYDSQYFEVLKISEGNLGLTVFNAEDKESLIDINVAALGPDVPLAGNTIATVEFRAKGSGAKAIISLAKIDVRGLRNEKPDDKLAKVGTVGLNLSVGKPEVTKAFCNYPNPFNPETWIPFQLEKATDVDLKIYNMQGHLVKTISLARIPAGYYLNKDKALQWDGRNRFGEKVSSGIYFYRFQAGEVVRTNRMVLLR